ncbi:MAG: XisI protein [Oculatellaceae cyanobacterium Prado106]|jgi:hypothetical protein|nr:XisI protein [Oculatellaceae cyanobacterium Prado106]
MDKLAHYRQIIQTLLGEYAGYKSLNPNIEREFVCDTMSDRYLVVSFGWEGSHQIYSCSVHMEIKNEKIWIQRNLTDIDFAEELVDLGVPKTDIVLGFHSPFKRQFTEYAVS